VESELDLTETAIIFLKKTAASLKGSARRVFMVDTVEQLGPGGQRRAEIELGWARTTIRLGQREGKIGMQCVPACNLRGRKPVEFYLPNLLADIKSIAEGFSQTDPQFRNKRLYTRLTVSELRRQLIVQKGYASEALPGDETLRLRMNQMGFILKKVQKSKPLKKIPETNAIFNQLAEVNKTAHANETVLRISMDAKAVVKMGDLSRNGRTRAPTAALDHDFKGTMVTPLGLFLPQHDELYIYMVTRSTSDCQVDCLHDFWQSIKHRFPLVTTFAINIDNGPDCNSYRTQFMKRLVDFSQESGITIDLAYYPPYHSKYNPVERCWGILENHWNGSILDSIEAVVGCASSMTWKGRHPVVKLVDTVYEKGITLGKVAMRAVEAKLQRLAALPRWFVTIQPEYVLERQ
jgi:hypothetical protein